MEAADWSQVASWCKDANQQAVTRFETVIPQIKDVQLSEVEFAPGGATGRLGALFAQLTADIERELPSECRRTAKAPS